MSAMSGMSDGFEVFLTEVARTCGKDPWLSTMGGGIIAAITLDIAHDSRSFARTFGIEHALVLREVQILEDMDRLQVTRRDERTQRCSYQLAAIASAA